MNRRTLLRGMTTAALASLGGCRRGDTAVPAAGAPAGSGAIAPDASEAPAGGEGSPGPGAEDPFASLRGFCDGVDPPTDQERAAAREVVRKHLGDDGLGAVICEPGVNMEYLAGVRWGTSERPFLLVLTRDADPAWVCPAFEEGTAREQLGPKARVLVWHEHESPYARAAELVGKKGRVALDPAMRRFLSRGLSDALGRKRVNATADPVGRARIVKTPAELARLRRANEATKAALSAVAGRVTEGMAEAELAALVKQAQEAAGLTRIWTLSLFGPSAAYPHGTREGHRIREGELVLVDTGGSLHGYRSDITRTWALGKPDAETTRAWNLVRDAQRAALDRIRPGVPCHEPEAAARKVIVDGGFGPDYQFFTHRLGHGIGLQVHEPPYLVRGNERVLEPGMTMSNEPGIYARGKLGVRLEDIVAVTDDGAEVYGPLAESLERPFG